MGRVDSVILDARADHHRRVTGFGAFLQYDVAAGCPAEADFRLAVERRGAELASGGGDGLRSVGVSIRSVPGGFSGEVRIEPRQGAAGTRAVRAASCVEVVDGLALVTAIALRDAEAAAALRRERLAPSVIELGEAHELAHAEPSPEQCLEERRARELLDAVIARLPLELRTVFVLYELEGLQIRDIAEIEGIPLGTASSRLRRAREEFSSIARRLRAALSGKAVP